jgi:hypothetical protein
MMNLQFSSSLVLYASAPDLPEALTEGREGMYIKSFYDRLVGHFRTLPLVNS